MFVITESILIVAISAVMTADVTSLLRIVIRQQSKQLYKPSTGTTVHDNDAVLTHIIH